MLNLFYQLFIFFAECAEQYSTCSLTSVSYKLNIILGSLFIIILTMPKTLLALL